MARLIIKNYSNETVLKEKIFGFIPNKRTFINYYLSINPPNNKEERIYLGKQIVKYNFQTKQDYVEFFDMTEVEYERNRTLKIQNVINKLEKEGFHVRTDQLSLFINGKIDNLILETK